MARYKLTYFDFAGGRGESVRLAFILGNIPFEDERLSFEQWTALKEKSLYGALPILHIDGKALAQSGSLCRYVGKLSNLYPTDSFQAAICDEVMEAIEEVTMLIGNTMRMPEDEKKAKREILAREFLPPLLNGINGRVKEGTSLFVAADQLSVADLKLFDLTNWLRSGILDYLPTNLVDTCAPQLVAHCEKISQIPKIAEHLKNRKPH
jgi:prostaglandin-H2 D-isomerase / glutathione transferase